MLRADILAHERRRGLPIPSLILVAGALLAWELLALRGAVRVLFFPPPSAWATALRAMWESGVLLSDAAVTGRRFALGMGLGVLGGWLTGLALGLSRGAYAVLDPIIAILHPLPKVALYPLLLLLLGFGETPKVAVIAISAFFPMFVSTALGVRNVEAGHLEVARSFRAPRIMLLRRVVVPSSIPYVLAGLRLALNGGLTVTVAIELLTAGDGFGTRIWLAWQTLRTDQLYAVLVVLATCGLILNEALERLARRLEPWRG
jgi:ABC-type nitrate/sulfonate/bicarbonate transport system permease component